ncbi:copper-translocating P-type ATPase [Chitiniphilus shinanonensis]|uniref:Copper-translocating P-type ATPase n=1 Tax=Chitiniphilus shinanonensis TaxID=553088 RepID=A0ABQ6BMN6_9NEIS|nr:heavy metal translocating P-type ATPase [Chitiniphilus shinanonensis]GLS03126.1 copper-translocating P-type ATPase [Chitiniphilus shinanonensis]
MNTATPAPAACFHCGEPVPAGPRLSIRYREQEQAVCCAGCQAVAQSILDAGLGDYYTQRDRPADRAAPLADELLEQLRLYDDPALQAGFVHAEGGDTREASLMIEGIVCAACVWLNERQLARVPGVQAVSINYSTHRARVRWDNARVQLSQILRAVADIGYRAQPYDAARQEAAQEQERKRALFRLWVAGLSMMQVMMFAVPIYLAREGEIDAVWLNLMNWASGLLTLPVVLYSSWPFYTSSWRDLRRGRAGMDLPVSVGVLSAFGASLIALLAGHGEVYFDSVSMFVFLLLAGRYLETRARQKAGAALEGLVKLIPAFAHRLAGWPGDTRPHETPVGALKPGDVLLVRPGETIPSDGTVLDGRCEVDEALLTGESRPIAKQPDDALTGGTVNRGSPLVMRVDQVGEGTRLAGIVRLLDRALAEKPRVALVADRVAGWFVAILLLVAAATWLYWHLNDPTHALPITVAVLVISCPCALSLATPAALTAATGALARQGVLVTRGHALEALSRVSDVVFDKTGTLTQGTPQVVGVTLYRSTEAEARQLAAALEAHSEHPLARALHGDTPFAAHEVVNHPGGGLTGRIGGVRFAIGGAGFVAHHTGQAIPPDDSGHTRVALANDTGWIADFHLADTLRDDAADAVARLRQAGLVVHLLSGDHPAAAQQVAAQLGIGRVTASATPEHKLAYLKTLQHNGARVLMVGDGVNDAPVLAAADVSMAMGAATDVAQAAGDAVLYDNRLAGVPLALRTARATRRIIRQNLGWALGYNLVALPLAVAGLVTPWLASLGMALSSLIVVGNALRLAPTPGRHRNAATAPHLEK